MLRVLADHPHHTTAMDDLALVANLLNRRTYLHEQLPTQKRPRARSLSGIPSRGLAPAAPASQLWLLVSVNDAAAVQIVGTQFHRNTITGKDTDKVFPHASG